MMLNLTEIANQAIVDYGNRYSAYIESEPLGNDVQPLWDFLFSMAQRCDGKEVLRMYIPQTNEKFAGVRLIAPSQETFSIKRRPVDGVFVIDIGTHTQDFIKLDTAEQQEALMRTVLLWAVENTPETLHPVLVKQAGEAEAHMQGRLDDEAALPPVAAASGAPSAERR